jgi:ribosomal protein L40E
VDVEFHQPAQEIFVTKPEELEAAKAGADVHCPYCDARNPANATFCGACGGGLEDAEKREAGKVLGAHRSGEPLPKICPSCNTRNLANAVECAGCGDSLAVTRPESKKELPKETKKGGLPVGIIIGAVVACLAVGGLLWILFGRTEETVATVASIDWSRSIPIEMLGELEAEAWFDEVPGDAEIQTCQNEYRYSQDEPAPGAVEVCGEPYTVDEGSGYGEVVQDCEYEIYDDWCTYTTIDWIIFDTVTVSGNDLNPYWPEAVLTSDQRFGDGQESYVVTFSGPDRTYSYTPESESEFSEFAIGSTWNLKVNAVGGVVSLEPAR